MTRQDVVVSFSIGSMFLLLACSLIIGGAFLAQPGCEPNAVMHPPRLGPSNSVLKEAIDELKYGPVNRDKQNEIKDGLLDRLRARRQARLCPPQVERPQTYANTPNVCTVINGPTEVCRVCPPRPGPETNPVSNPTPPVQYPAVSIDSLLLPMPQDCPSCVRGSDVKTGAFVCSHCGRPCVGDEWHTDWQADGTPLTFLCERCYRALSPEQRQAVFERYLKSQAANPLRGLSPEVAK